MIYKRGKWSWMDNMVDGELSGGLVGASGFEPETSCAQGRRATGLRYAPTIKTIKTAPLYINLRQASRDSITNYE